MSTFILNELDQRVREAVKFFWSTRAGQNASHSTGVKRGQGNRGAVTGGKQLDGFITILKQLLIENGLDSGSIFHNSNLEIPGFYRPSKKWDLLVVHDGHLVLAIELKSQVGPSFGNNFNNRTEEAMGSALDIWTAFREGVFKESTPWLGYLMLLEDCTGSSLPVSIRSPHFDVMSEFVDSSYTRRYELFCEKLIRERQYNAVCFLTAKRENSLTGDYSSPNSLLGFVPFATSMIAAVTVHLARKDKA